MKLRYHFSYIILFLFCSCFPTLASQYTGHVYLDKNGDHSFDKNDKGLAGISVSDGLNVVQTNSKGEFQLPGHDHARFIYITIPSGYRTNTYYRRITDQSAPYDFELEPANKQNVKADGTHRFIHISDTHMYDEMRTALDGHAISTQKMRDYVANEHISFIIHTGDITREGFKSYKYFLNNENMPSSQVFYCIGNHDLGSGKYGEEAFENHFGPAYYSFEVGNIHYIVTPMSGGDGRPDYTQERIAQWLHNDLKHVSPDKAIIAFNHSVKSGDGHFRFGSKDSEYIDLADYNLKAWLYGHWHHHRMYKYDGSDVQMICSPGQIRGSYDHSPSSFRVLTADANGQLSSEIRYSYMDKSVTIASIDNGQAAVTNTGTVPLSVNAYSTSSPVQQVTYSCNSQNKSYITDRNMKQNTDFNWSSEIQLPESLNGQIITVAVTATFANGEVAKERTTFRYEHNKSNAVQLNKDWANLLQTPAHVPDLKDTLKLPLQLAWVQNIGANIFFTSPLVYKQAIYAASLDDNGKGKASIACMDPHTGAIRWQYPLRHSVRSSIAAEDGCIFAQDINGWLYAVDAATGLLVWEKDLNMDKQVPLDDGLVTAEGVVYAGTGRALCALKAKTGELIWQNKDWDTAHGTVATLAVHDGVLTGQAFWESAHANDARTGKKLWSRGPYGFGSSSAIHKDLIYSLINSSLFVVDAKSGKPVIQKTYDFELKNLSTPLVTDQEIIFGTATNGIVAVDRATLEVKWNFKTGPAMIYTVPTLGDPTSPVETSPVVSGDVVYMGASDGVLYALDRKTGLLIWKHAMGAPVFGSVAISGNALFAVDFAGNVYGFTSK
ncbi:MAG: PQQ-binding-like beta-propeller repeat protein [Tannerellaceae bacterium]